jgi:OmpA-OmpF porin, OOP family
MQLSKPLFWLLTALWFAAGAWWYSKSECSSCNAPSVGTTTEKISLPGFSVADGNWNLSSANNLRFGKSGNIPVLGNDISLLIDSLALYAKMNPTKKITVTGHYTAEEKNGTSFENLGLARADELKKILISRGITDKNILTDSKLDDSLTYSPADTLVGGITMAINNEAAAAPVATKPVEDLFEPRNVYFNTGKNSLNVDADLKNYLEKANKYLQSHTDKKLMVTGHTDNVGDAAKNMELSANRAAFVKEALTKEGIAGTRIESTGKGPAEPIADNNTAEGKAKNRRVSIQIQ